MIRHSNALNMMLLSSPVRAFGTATVQSLLATLRKWQGWSDLFLTTPADGILSPFLTLSAKLGYSLSLAF